MVHPIFGLGLARNGTTWLQNILCNHKEIVGAQHKVHWGIKESKIYKNIQYWADFEDNDKFIRFLELYSSGDYFNMVEGEKEYFYQNRPKDFIEFFFELMDDYAKKKKVTYWTTKLDFRFYRDPDLLEEFLNKAQDRYEKIKFIGIQRNYKDVLTSAINMPGREERKKLGLKEAFAIFTTFKNAYGYNTIDKIISQQNGLKLEFNKLKNDRSKVVEKIVNYLDLDYSGEMLEDYYLPNSSFRDEVESVTLTNWEQKLIANFLYSALQKENFLNGILRKTKDKFLSEISPNSCPLRWRLIKYEKFPKEFKKELEENGQIGLKRALFEEENK